MNPLKIGCLGFIMFWGLLLGTVTLAVGGMGAGGSTAAVATGPPGVYLWPVTGPITTAFGMRVNPYPPHNDEMHWGIDIAADQGTAILAATDGEVVSAGWAGNYGNLVILVDRNGLVTYYGHMVGFAVALNEHVMQGQVIGFVGSTGKSTGPHLHFEMRPHGGNPVDPLTMLPATLTKAE